jgi:hypothetical protein
MHSHAMSLDPDLRCADAIEFENDLRQRFIGQEEATVITVRMIQTFMAGMNNPDQPAGILLALGPTGTGKTRSRRPALPKNLARARGAAIIRPSPQPYSTATEPPAVIQPTQPLLSSAPLSHHPARRLPATPQPLPQPFTQGVAQSFVPGCYSGVLSLRLGSFRSDLLAGHRPGIFSSEFLHS